LKEERQNNKNRVVVLISLSFFQIIFPSVVVAVAVGF
jgi:hypothetical protein